MKSFEAVYEILNLYFIEELTGCINTINIEHNDGIILKEFKNKSLGEKSKEEPSYTFTLEEAEYNDKDRLIENNVFLISLEINLPQNLENSNLILWRYIESIEKLINYIEDFQEIKITTIKKNKIYIRITM